ncbi:MAG: xanthine dehydrogenase family protein molybdopterin-binding subunit [Deltaproteobacteria bacterium]|nr:xanthine dehydrogenase family protein molybdopterin-binding subunit [Deltaproteobacteria bacterium]MBW2137409.1 xanthine dehydrogenase family protein molybdopterin-binding subunit [Deltaproteobacteria bacterium]
MKTSISRREFLKGSLAATGLTIAASVTPFGYKILSASEMKKGAGSSFKPNVWVEITPDDMVTLTLGASEMGQGSHTSLAMILADELDADWEKVRIVQGPAAKEFFNPIMHAQIAVASSTVRGFYAPLRKVGASARAVLLQAASSMLGVPGSECETSKGIVRHKKTGKSMTYGELCIKASMLPLPKDPQLKKHNDFRYMGKYVPRADIPDKVQGRAVYGHDVDLPGMLYAVLARPPAYGAKPVTFDGAAAEKVKGVSKVVPTPHGIGVCADTLDAAWKGREALNVTWDKGLIPEMDTEYVEKSLMGDLDKPGSTAANVGDAKKALTEASKKIEAVYYVPFVAHVTMEPMNCTAHVKKDSCDVWVPTQAQTVSQILASQVSGLPQEKVNIHTTYLGGGLGRRARPDFVIEAVLLSKAAGRPVKVFWTREEDIKYDAFRAAMAHRIQAGLDSRGRLTAWSHKAVSGSILKDINPKAIQNGVDMMSLWGLLDFPNSPNKNRIMYEIPNFFVEFLLSDLPIPVCPWRSVQNGPNAFVIESFVDELAHAAGRDPLEFRLSLLKNNKRTHRVLEKVAEEAGWGKPGIGDGRGIAQHTCFGTYTAQVADVSVDRKTGEIKVHRVVAAIDCGPAVNPDNIKAQVMGAIVMGLSTVLKEEIQFADGGVSSENFEDYDVLRVSETPEIQVHIVDSDDQIGGIGEPGLPATAPAVANAVFDATGVRFRRIPLTPERVLAGLKGKQV